jgi:hypothetical protein
MKNQYTILVKRIPDKKTNIPSILKIKATSKEEALDRVKEHTVSFLGKKFTFEIIH